MSPDDVVGAFVFGTYKLVIDEHGLDPAKTDPADIQAVGTGAILAYRIAAKSENISDGFLSRLAVQVGVLLAAQRGVQGGKAATEFYRARDEYVSTRDDWNT